MPMVSAQASLTTAALAGLRKRQEKKEESEYNGIIGNLENIVEKGVDVESWMVNTNVLYPLPESRMSTLGIRRHYKSPFESPEHYFGRVFRGEEKSSLYKPYDVLGTEIYQEINGEDHSEGIVTNILWKLGVGFFTETICYPAFSGFNFYKHRHMLIAKRRRLALFFSLVELETKTSKQAVTLFRPFWTDLPRIVHDMEVRNNIYSVEYQCFVDRISKSELGNDKDVLDFAHDSGALEQIYWVHDLSFYERPSELS